MQVDPLIIVVQSKELKQYSVPCFSCLYIFVQTLATSTILSSVLVCYTSQIQNSLSITVLMQYE